MIKDCIDAAVRQGHITQAEGDLLKKRFDAIAKQVLSPVEAKAQLVKEIEIEAAERERRAHIAHNVLTRALDNMKNYRNLKGEADEPEAYLRMYEDFGRMGSYIADASTLHDVIVAKAHGQLADVLLENKKGLITGDLRRRMSPRVRARMDNVVRELFGETTNDAMAAAMAKAWTDTAEQLRVRFNAAGGAIGQLHDWGMPQGHDPQALLDYGKDKWVAYMMQDGVLDRDKTVHPLTKRKFSDDELRESLGVVWDRITTDGWIDREVSGSGTGKTALWSQHADHRFLHFKNADAWMTYANKFGNPDPFAAMMAHINRMARDIAHMETFGPNPNVFRAFMADHLRSKAAQIKSNDVVMREQMETMRELAGKLSRPNPDVARITGEIEALLHEGYRIRQKNWRGKHDDVAAEFDRIYSKVFDLRDELKGTPETLQDAEIARAIDALSEEMRDPIQFATRRNPETHLKRTLDIADGMWELARGSKEPVSVNMANNFAATRNLISSALLGSAWFSSLNDPTFGQDMRLRMGMGMAKSNAGTILVKVLTEMVTKGNREDAVRAGLGLESAINVMHRTAKENKHIDARAWTGYLADRTLALWGLSPWTQAGKHYAGLDLMGFFADQSKNDWSRIPEGLRKGLTTHGFDAASWDAIRNVPLYEPKRGAFYLQPADIERAVGRDLAERYAGMLLRETRFAVPETTLRSRAATDLGKPGTLKGEVWRSMLQFKGFPMAVVFLHANRMARELLAGDRSAAAYAGVMLITGTFLGALAGGLKDIKDGRDPRKWLDEKTYLDPQFWGAAVLQSGGLGIYGDFLFSNTGRTGGGLGKTMAGPLVDRVDNLLGLTIGNAAQGIRGEKTNRGREAVKFLRTNTPVIGNAPFIGLAYQRILMDQLQRLADPEAHLDFRRQIQHRRKDFNQDFWWAPGNTAPARGPDLTRPFATR